jgi:hypothetical protein
MLFYNIYEHNQNFEQINAWINSEINFDVVMGVENLLNFTGLINLYYFVEQIKKLEKVSE